jgi:hypothetical protein
MAKQTEVQLEGTFGDLIFYKSKGGYFIRSKGKTGNQSPIAKVQSSILGKASGISGKLRTHFKPMIIDPKNRELMYRLNNVLQQWLRTNPINQQDKQDIINPLHGFSFNADNELVSLFHAAMPIHRNEMGTLSMDIPSFDSPNPLAPMPFYGTIDIKVIAVSCNLNDSDDVHKVETGVFHLYDGTPIAAQTLVIDLATAPGRLTVVAVSINNLVSGIVGTFFN